MYLTSSYYQDYRPTHLKRPVLKIRVAVKPSLSTVVRLSIWTWTGGDLWI
jgi:hypothetical protein